MNSLKPNDKKIIWVSATVFLFLLDRLFKSWAVKEVFSRPVSLVGEIVTFNLQLNPQIAFSLPLKGKWLTWSISIILLILIFYLARAVKKHHYYYFLALLALTLGATSNLADRFLFKGVIDYLDIKYLTVFNVADIMIIGGILGLFYLLIYHRDRS